MNQKELFFISSTVFLTILAWVLFDLYDIRLTPTTDAQLEALIFNYTIDTKVFDVLRNKIP